MLDTTLVTTARSIKSFLVKIKADALLSIAQSIYHSVFLKDNGKNFIRKRVNDEVYKFVPSLAVFADIYEPHILSWLKKWLHQGDVFWDVGANIGLTSLPAARIIGESGEIIAIEPSPANAALLQRHITLNVNGHENIVTIIEAAVCDQDGGSITFSLIEDGLSPCNSLMFSGSVSGDAPKVSRDVTVPAISLDGLLAKEGRFPNLVKIDVEGAELKVIKGATKLLSSQSAPILLLAIHPFWLETPEDSQEIVSLLKGWGYQIFNRDGENVEKVEYDEYLCLPPSL
jgi:FkbM family methyltransferase